MVIGFLIGALIGVIVGFVIGCVMAVWTIVAKDQKQIQGRERG